MPGLDLTSHGAYTGNKEGEVVLVLILTKYNLMIHLFKTSSKHAQCQEGSCSIWHFCLCILDVRKRQL